MSSPHSLTALDSTGAPIALLADLHANFEALLAVDARLTREGVRDAIVLGDLVGYGASPREVIDLVRRRGWRCIRGNHEELLLGRAPAARAGATKRIALRTLRAQAAQLGADDLAFLSALPASAVFDGGLIAVHGSLVDPDHCYSYIYEFSIDLNIAALRARRTAPGSLLLYGHTHAPSLIEVLGDAWWPLETGMLHELLPDRDYFVNPGSVGFPRDGDPRASLMLLDPLGRRLRHLRVEYDVGAAAARIRTAGDLPGLAERLLAAR